MSYLVTAPLVLARDKEGKVHERYQDAVIDWLDDDQKQHLVETGLVDDLGETAAPGDGPPAQTALKADWVAFAVSQGADPEGAEGSTKQELIDLYGE
jgi:hypothetical protein